jgi:signal transduction histidine kinase
MKNSNDIFLQVQVIDSGVGIQEEFLESMFKAFGYIDDGK